MAIIEVFFFFWFLLFACKFSGGIYLINYLFPLYFYYYYFNYYNSFLNEFRHFNESKKLIYLLSPDIIDLDEPPKPTTLQQGNNNNRFVIVQGPNGPMLVS